MTTPSPLAATPAATSTRPCAHTPHDGATGPRPGRRLRLSGPWPRLVLAGGLIVIALLLSRRAGDVTGGGGWRTDAPATLYLAQSLMLASAVVSGTPVARAALVAARARVVGIDLLVTVAALGAVVLGSLWEAAAVTFLFSLGHALEAGAMRRTRTALADLVDAAPQEATVLRGGEASVVPVGQVTVGDVVLVRAGTTVPVDGEVVVGAGAADEASVTGEPLPAEKGPGDRVHAGTVLTSGMVRVAARGVGADTTLARIVRRVEEAQDARARSQVLMERFSRWYTPSVIAAAVLTAFATRDLELALTLLVIGCPGALVISVPVAVVSGIGRGAREGVLIKGGEHLERAARVDAVAFDKTGTLTTGRPGMTDVVPADGVDEDTLLGWAARAEAGGAHPLGRAVIDGARRRGLTVTGVPDEAELLPGLGLVARLGGRRVAVGTVELVLAEVRAGAGPAGAVGQGAARALDSLRGAMDRLARAGRTPMVVVLDGEPLGVLAVADTVRTDAADAVAGLRRAGVREVMVLSGDRPEVARAVGHEVGVDDARGGLLPEDKLEAVRRLRSPGRTVAMVGDGVNDAPALAAADVGVAMGAAGSALAVETADIALMGERLDRLPWALGLARRTVRVMRQNVVIALLTTALLLAGVLLGGVTMSLGMLVHELSVLVVIVNALRLLRR